MICSKLAFFELGISNFMYEFESFIFWHVRMDSKIILATFKISNVGGFFVILSALLHYLSTYAIHAVWFIRDGL